MNLFDGMHETHAAPAAETVHARPGCPVAAPFKSTKAQASAGAAELAAETVEVGPGPGSPLGASSQASSLHQGTNIEASTGGAAEPASPLRAPFTKAQVVSTDGAAELDPRSGNAPLAVETPTASTGGCTVLESAPIVAAATDKHRASGSVGTQNGASSSTPQCVLGKTIVMVLLCHSSECGCFVCFA